MNQPVATQTDRRTFRRAPLDRPVLLETDTRSSTARIINVSGGGIAVRTDLGLVVGERMSVYFELPIGYAVQVDAVVLRREGEVAALRFVDAPHEAVLAVRSFCRISGLVPAARRAGP